MRIRSVSKYMYVISWFLYLVEWWVVAVQNDALILFAIFFLVLMGFVRLFWLCMSMYQATAASLSFLLIM